ncbi:coiled-coil domain-containing protein [Aquilutibacter rugosus]|uniref:hypothetical protein n=1 Tax=Aquilutibacter rugosus TaxID=3115820 RepID=UPI002F42D0B4
MGVFIEISDSVVPVVQQTAQTFVPQAWVPQGAAAVVPSPTDLTATPVAGGVIVSWVLGATGLTTIVESGPSSSGPWTVAARSGDTTVTIGLTAAAYIRATHESNGIQSAPTLAVLATPVDVSKALQDASNALAAADGDVTFTKSATQPMGASYGDIWQDSDDGAIYRWLDVDGNGSFQWEPRPNDALALAIIAAAGAQGTADGKVRLVFSESAPTGWVAGDEGDQWFKLSTKQLSVWNGSAFLASQDYDAQAKLADIVSDNIISRAEKLSEVINWNEAVNALSSDQSKASAAGVSHADYTSAYTALESYINGLSPALTDRTADTPVAGATYVSLWNTYRTQRALLLNAIAGAINDQVSNAASDIAEGWSPVFGWEFLGDGDYRGFTATNANINMFPTTSGGALAADATAGDPNFITPAFSLRGANATVVRAKMRTRGSAVRDGYMYWATDTFGFGGTAPLGWTILSEKDGWFVAEWDLTANGYWTGRTITRLRFDIQSNGTGASDIQWISIGRNGYGATGDAVAAFTAVTVRMPGGTDMLVTANAAAADATAKADQAKADALAALAVVNAKADTAMAKIADIANAPSHSTANAYLEDALVKQGSGLYRAKVAVPAGIAITNTAYWEYVGEYDSIGEALAASIAKGNANATALASEVSRMDALLARVPASGNLVNQAAILAEQEARASEDSALATRATNLEATVNSTTDGNAALKARIASEETTRAGQHEAQATQISGIIATNNDQQNQINSKASITQLNEAIAGEAGARATAISNVQADYNDKLANKASVTQLNDAIASEQGARASAISGVQADYNGKLANKASITQLNEAIAGEAGARATAISNVQADYNDKLANKASITQLNEAIANEQGARASAISGVQADYNGKLANKASITQLNEAIAGEAGARASSIAAIQGQLDNPTTGLLAKASNTRVDTIDLRATALEEPNYGRNVLTNSTFNNGRTGWEIGFQYGPMSGFLPSQDVTGADWQPIGVHSMGGAKGGVDGDGQINFRQLSRCHVGERWFAGCNLQTHRGRIGVQLSFYSSSDTANPISYQQISFTQNDSAGGFKGVFADAPNNAYWVAIEIIYGTNGGDSPYWWAWNPILCNVPAGQTTFPIYRVGPYEDKASIDASVSSIQQLNLAVGGVNGAAVSSTSLTYRANQLEATKVEFLKVGNKVAGWRAATTDTFSSFQMQFDSIELLTGTNTGVSITKTKMDRVFGNAAFYEGDPFGTDGLVFWIGPKSIAKSDATKANGTFWISSAGDRGGGAMIGKFGTSRATATSSTPNFTVEVSTGNFERSSSNAQITVSVGMATFRTSSGSGTNSTAAQSVSGVIEKSVDGGAWTQVGGWSARGSYNVEYDSGVKFETSEVSGGGYAADTTSGTNIAYRARRTGGSVNLVSGVANNMTITITVEQV